MVDCQGVQPFSKTSLGRLTITCATSIEGGKKDKFWFTKEPAPMSMLFSSLTEFKKFDLLPLVC